MKDDGLVYTQVTEGLIKILMKIRNELEAKEKLKKRKRIRITKREICQELYKRCIIKKVV